jgi:hypothetical protein
LSPSAGGASETARRSSRQAKRCGCRNNPASGKAASRKGSARLRAIPPSPLTKTRGVVRGFCIYKGFCEGESGFAAARSAWSFRKSRLCMLHLPVFAQRIREASLAERGKQHLPADMSWRYILLLSGSSLSISLDNDCLRVYSHCSIPR